MRINLPRCNDSRAPAHVKDTIRYSKHFAALTVAEEALGLYAEPSLIGFRLARERLLAAKGASYRGHRVVVPVPGDHCRRKSAP
jgi:hypothetical protein